MKFEISDDAGRGFFIGLLVGMVVMALVFNFLVDGIKDVCPDNDSGKTNQMVYKEDVTKELGRSEGYVKTYENITNKQNVRYAYRENAKDVNISKIDGFVYMIEGWSMRPCLQTGNIGLRQTYVDQELEVGNIVRFNYENQSIVHAVTEVGDDYVITQGYNNKYPDGKIPKKDITDVIVGVIFT